MSGPWPRALTPARHGNCDNPAAPTPWNPSPEAETWLHGLADAYGFASVWRGLDHVEQQC